MNLISLSHRKEVTKRAGAAGAGEQDPRKAQLRAMFSRLAGHDGEVDAEELQDILTTTLAKDQRGSVFSLDACRAMISMLDVSWKCSWEYVCGCVCELGGISVSQITDWYSCHSWKYAQFLNLGRAFY